LRRGGTNVAFAALSGIFDEKCNLLKGLMVIYAYNHTARLLSPEPLVVEPQSTRVEETFLCNQVPSMTGSVVGGSKIRGFGHVVGYPKGIQIVTCGSVLGCRLVERDFRAWHRSRADYGRLSRTNPPGRKTRFL
jgi:hypothetical protein